MMNVLLYPPESDKDEDPDVAHCHGEEVGKGHFIVEVVDEADGAVQVLPIVQLSLIQPALAKCDRDINYSI